MDIALWVEQNIMMGVVWRRQKMRKSHIDAANQWAREIPSIDVNARSRDCHATDALEL